MYGLVTQKIEKSLLDIVPGGVQMQIGDKQGSGVSGHKKGLHGLIFGL
jgi:hypothetical protein